MSQEDRVEVEAMVLIPLATNPLLSSNRASHFHTACRYTLYFSQPGNPDVVRGEITPLDMLR